MNSGKTRAALAAAMLVGVSVFAGCGGEDTVESSDTPPLVQPTPGPSSSPTPSTSPNATPAAGEPEFLAAADWPTGERYGTWNAQGEEEGLPDPEYFCIAGLLPEADTEYQSYGSDLEAEGRQFVVEADSPEKASSLAAELVTAVDGCVERYAKAFPVDEVSGEQLGTLELGDGVSLAARYFAPKDSEYNLQLFAVGRVGATVTVVVLGQGGTAQEAPKDAFKTTVTTAMGKIGAEA